MGDDAQPIIRPIKSAIMIMQPLPLQGCVPSMIKEIASIIPAKEIKQRRILKMRSIGQGR